METSEVDASTIKAFIFLLFLFIFGISFIVYFIWCPFSREEKIKKGLGGVSIETKSSEITNLLKESLPEGYQCKRKDCPGILLKKDSEPYFVCSICGNKRKTINKSDWGFGK